MTSPESIGRPECPRVFAPTMVSGSITAIVFKTWLREQRCSVLLPPALLILDNARFHQPEVVIKIAAAANHQVLVLPPYSPNFNKIAHNFAALKRILGYAKAPFSGATPKIQIFVPPPY